MQEEGAGLLVSLDQGAVGRPVTDEAIAAQWFSQDVFAGAPPLAAAEPAAPARKNAGAKSLLPVCLILCLPPASSIEGHVTPHGH
jgi:hypothetical protein